MFTAVRAVHREEKCLITSNLRSKYHVMHGTVTIKQVQAAKKE